MKQMNADIVSAMMSPQEHKAHHQKKQKTRNSPSPSAFIDNDDRLNRLSTVNIEESSRMMPSVSGV